MRTNGFFDKIGEALLPVGKQIVGGIVSGATFTAGGIAAKKIHEKLFGEIPDEDETPEEDAEEVKD